MNRLAPSRNRSWRSSLVLASVLTLLSPCRSALGWGRERHQIVALIAERYMTDEARAKASDLLHGNTIDGIASWADDYRRDHPETGPWHYIDIPLADSKIDLARECPNGDCVVVKTEGFLAVLRDPKADRTTKAEALKYVIHFIGDLTSHCTMRMIEIRAGIPGTLSSTVDPTTCIGSGTQACWSTSTEIRKRSQRSWRVESRPRIGRNG
jgi:S1/P1 Nuclease